MNDWTANPFRCEITSVETQLEYVQKNKLASDFDFSYLTFKHLCWEWQGGKNIFVPFFFFLLARLTDVADRLPQNYCFIISLEQKPMICCHPLTVKLKVAQFAPQCVATCYYSQGAALLLKAEFAQHRFFHKTWLFWLTVKFNCDMNIFFNYTCLCNYQ